MAKLQPFTSRVLKGPQRRVRVVGPVPPGAASQAVLTQARLCPDGLEDVVEVR